MRILRNIMVPFFCILFCLVIASTGFAESHLISEFPDKNEKGYEWYRGCGPTALSMVLNYWGSHGFEDLYVEPEPHKRWDGPFPWYWDWLFFPIYTPGALIDDVVDIINSDRSDDNKIPKTGGSEGDYVVFSSELAKAATVLADSYGYDFDSEVREYSFQDIKEEINSDRPIVLAFNLEENFYKDVVLTLERGPGDKDDLVEAAKENGYHKVNYIEKIFGVASKDGSWDWDTHKWSGATKEYEEGTDFSFEKWNSDNETSYIDWSPPGSKPSELDKYKVACKIHLWSGHAVAVFGYDDAGGTQTMMYWTTWRGYPARTKNFSNLEVANYVTVKPVRPPVDLIFVIDTTGSMWDDIDAAKASAIEIVNKLDSSGADYRVAVVSYRDFPIWPYGCTIDWPYKAVLPFSTDKSSIVAAINSLYAYCGADWQESVYSALIRSINTEGLGAWRDNVKKVIILMGDAPPHDPEPFTGYTLSDVIAAAAAVDPATIYPIFIGWSSITRSYFEALAEGTGGEVFEAATASEVVDAILEAIETALKAPIADADGPYEGRVGAPITFDASGSYDPDGTIVQYEWDFDNDGVYDATVTTPITTYTYWAEYSGIVKLRVTDDDGLNGIDTASVEVTTPAITGDLDGDGDVDRDDLNKLLKYRNQPASECPECDLDGDGVITVLDARKLVLLCTRPRCATE